MDNGFLYGDGVYETMRGYNGIILDLDSHIKRLQKSTGDLGIKIHWPIPKLKKWIEKTVDLNKAKSSRIRLTISRGPNGMNFTTCKNPTLVISCEKLKTDHEIYKKGVSVITIKTQRILPEAKTIGLTHVIMAYRAIKPKNIFEAVIVDKKNFVKEGMATNIFMVKSGKIITPETGILMGTTRKRIIELAKKIGLKVVIKDFKIGELAHAEEIFITNKLKEVVPVVILNGKKVGSGKNKGKVGETTKKIMKAYQNFVKAYIKRQLL